MVGIRVSKREDGQIVPLVAYLAVPILILVALVVDIGSFYLRANELQTVSDLAALAGAETLSEGGSTSDVQNIVNEIAQANGIDPDVLQVNTQVVGSTVSVSIADPDVKQFFSQIVTDDISVAKDATATTGACESCGIEIEIQSTDVQLPSAGQGDGYKPVIVEDGSDLKLFAINHHVPSTGYSSDFPGMVCVNMNTKEFCPGFPKYLSGSTGHKPRLTVGVDNIWFLTTRHNSDGSSDSLFNCMNYDGSACSGWGNYWESWRGGGTKIWSSTGWAIATYMTDLWAYDGRVYAVDFNGRVHCRDAVTTNDCWGGYRTPQEWSPSWDQAWVQHSGSQWNWNFMNQESMISNGKLYTLWPRWNPLYSNDLLCFDLETEAACSGNAHRHIWGTSHSLFPHHINGQENGVCSVRWDSTPKIDCYDESDNKHQLYGLAQDIAALDSSSSSMPLAGSSIVERHGNVLIIPFIDWNNTNNSRTYCIVIDGDSGTPCSSSGVRSDPGAPYAYSKVPGVDCFVTLGHHSTFDFFSPELDDCDPGVNRFWINACECNDGIFEWGRLDFGTDLSQYLDSLVVTIEDSDGNVLHGPIEIIGSDGSINLSQYVPDGEEGIWLRIQADEAPGFNWEVPLGANVEVSERAGLIS